MNVVVYYGKNIVVTYGISKSSNEYCQETNDLS